jgi:hypothetical protein
MSDLDAHIGYFESAETCWESCSQVFGDILYAIDFCTDEENTTDLGDCYCQHDCFCMTSLGDETLTTMTLDSLEVVPAPCDGEEWESEFDGDDDCAWGHDEREGETSEERCYAMEGCLYDEVCDHCFREGTEWAGCDWEEWDQDFDFEDWRSNFDFTSEYWMYDFDWTMLFPTSYEEDGNYWFCDDSICWYYSE